MKPGDVLLVRGASLPDAVIRLAQRRRFPAGAAMYTHAALIVDATGRLIEAAGAHGVRRNAIAAYAGRCTVCDTGLSDDARTAAVSWATRRIGTAYDWLDILSVGAALLVCGSLVVHRDDTWICSALVAEALMCAGVDLGHDPATITPAALAMRYRFGATHP